ncbi:DUF397 domain-containing protein [Streptomyces sp. NPDC048192]|uniref:DUF397 domain-containing protein n=1 Tax=Streptomyces sp. NPDC048192 TaxID=3365510 RepID=UPI00371B52D0
MSEQPEVHWYKSSYSGGSGTECVECAHTTTGTLIRDSKQTESTPLRVQPKAWHAFISALAHNTLRW